MAAPLPASPVGGSREHRGEPIVSEMSQPELERVRAAGHRELVHRDLTGKRVRGRGQAPVGPNAKRR